MRARTMKWSTIWIKLFGTTSLFGVDMGFWVSISAVLLIVLAMNLVFWGMKPKKDGSEK